MTEEKIAHDAGGLTLELAQTRDILADLAAWRKGRARSPLLVGFAAETDDVAKHARDKLERKRLDLIVANDVSEPGAGFEVETNRVVILERDGAEEALPLMSKHDVAEALLDRVSALLGSRQ